MKQVLQNLKNGEIELAEVPCPKVNAGELLIQTSCSLISSGTERMLLEFGRAGFIDKARQQPDKVKQVLDKARTDGLLPTIDAVRSKLDQPLPLGYCNVGRVLTVGEGVTGFSEGDRVVSNGPHAEVVSVTKNLCAKIPDNVSDESAVFTVIGAIGLQGIRLAEPTMGESFVVIGLGIIGLVTVQLLRAQGCRVLGIDTDSSKTKFARKFGAKTVDLSSSDDPLAVALEFSRGRGVDGVLITASTKSSEPVSLAAKMCRKRGRIVLVGVTGLELNRDDFYKKELSFLVSCSYGPGRYDMEYEAKGHDYPFGYVRWTEQRNFEAVLDILDSGVDFTSLISHHFPIDQANLAYDLLGRQESKLGIILEYNDKYKKSLRNLVELKRPDEYVASKKTPIVCFIGAGNYAGRILIPAFQQAGARFDSVVTSKGVSGVHYGKKYGFNKAATDSREILENNDCNTVVIVTRHDTHANYVCESLQAGKNVFVEKPLALTLDELDKIEETYQKIPGNTGKPILMVGFNRRFAPHIVKMKELLTNVKEPKSFIMTVNAGKIPADSWVQDMKIGGGRIIGEACHFIDLLRFLASCTVSDYHATKMGFATGLEISNDKVTITLSFEDGSFGTIHYLANGEKSFPKERLEVFCAGAVLQLDNFRRLRGYGWPGFKKMNLWRQDKGQIVCAKAFMDAVTHGTAAPIPFTELMEVSRLSIDIALNGV
jgi:predicted dehydrogenase/threonine dehydrogenase-like Zn-dependent dehydrogenase